jgi:hypothetical protein
MQEGCKRGHTDGEILVCGVVFVLASVTGL